MSDTTSTTGTTQSLANKIIFHSATFPQFIGKEDELLKQVVDTAYKADGAVQMPRQIKNCKYTMQILFYQPRLTVSQTGAKVWQLSLKRKRICIGNNRVDPQEPPNPLTVKSMHSRYNKTLLSSEDFDVAENAARGGFLNKQLWQANLLWGSHADVKDNYLTAVTKMKELMPIVDIQLNSSGGIASASSKGSRNKHSAAVNGISKRRQRNTSGLKRGHKKLITTTQVSVANDDNQLDKTMEIIQLETPTLIN